VVIQGFLSLLGLVAGMGLTPCARMGAGGISSGREC
jgi:hypothetical protein